MVDVIRIATILQPDPPAITPFLAKETLSEVTRFRLEGEWDALAPGEAPRLFRYEVAVMPRKGDWNIVSRVICHEALIHFPKGRPRRLFERRDPGTPIYVAREFGITRADERLKAVAPHASVLATLDLLNVEMAQEMAKRLKNWLASTNVAGHRRFSLDTPKIIDLLEKNPEFRRRVSEQIRCSDLGISDMSIVETLGSKKVRFDHSGLDLPVDLDFESSGTQRLFSLLPHLNFALVTGLAILDEIDGDLHVDIVSEILGWFRSRESNPDNAQLLVTSHHVGLLDDLEKEEVFIIEKDDTGATRVHGAQDVRGLRRDARLYPKYRAGVLGGIPRIG